MDQKGSIKMKPTINKLEDFYFLSESYISCSTAIFNNTNFCVLLSFVVFIYSIIHYKKHLKKRTKAFFLIGQK